MAHYALALDVGGTFTDVMLMQRESGQLWTVKTPSTPADPSEGFFHGIQKMLHLASIAPEAVGHVLHGSTVATNTILEGKGASTGLITTERSRGRPWALLGPVTWDGCRVILTSSRSIWVGRAPISVSSRRVARW